MKKSIVFTLMISLVAIGAFVFLSINGANSQRDEKEGFPIDTNTTFARETSEGFIKSLFSANEQVLEYITGDVKHNLKDNISDLKKYDINEIKFDIEYISDKFASVNTIVEFTSNKDDVDVDFYRFYMVKEQDKYLIYKLENNIVLNEINTNDDITISTIGATDTIDEYFKDIESGFLSKSVNHLIGRAKANHLQSYGFISELVDSIDYNFTQLEHEILVENTGKIILVKSAYENNSNPIEIITTLYKTSKGWRIYDINQI